MQGLSSEIDKRLKGIFRDYFYIDINRFGIDELNEDLLGRIFMFKARDLLYLYFDIEKEFGITIPEEVIAAGKFNT